MTGNFNSMPAAALAKAALRRLAREQREPTPDNYARAYAAEEVALSAEGGATAPAPLPAAPVAAAASPVGTDNKQQGPLWAALIERIGKGLSRSSRDWTLARRAESLQRVLDGSRSDAQRLQQRLHALLGAWETGGPDEAAPTGLPTSPNAAAPTDTAWQAALLVEFESTVRAGLPRSDARASELAAELASELKQLGVAMFGADAQPSPTPAQLTALAAVCGRVRRLFGHRHQLVDQLDRLCRELTQGLGEMSEDDSWVRGQTESVMTSLAGGPSVRGVRAATELVAQTRRRQGQLRSERQAAREALKGLLNSMLGEVTALGDHTGRFQLAVGRHAQTLTQVVAHADTEAGTLQSLAGVVQAMLDESRAVTAAVGQSQQRLDEGRQNASELEGRVRELELELRRLSEEVTTDALTQVANRRGLAQAFELETARCRRELTAAGAELAETGLAVALIDIDNFKKLNDTLGHAAGDVALQTLAAAVKTRLRPLDHLSRFGGEEFVVLMPGSAIEQAQQALSRLQREISASLFMHDGKDVLVTFSAGVTRWRADEALQVTLERADEALYEAKRSGKNRTCVA